MIDEAQRRAILAAVAGHLERHDDAETAIAAMIGAAEYLSTQIGKDRARQAVAALHDAMSPT